MWNFKSRKMGIGALAIGALFAVSTFADIQQIQQAGYSLIKVAGSAVTARSVLNFPANMSCVDNSGTTPPETDCTPSGGGGGSGYQTIQQAGSSLAQEPILNFTSGVTCTDDSGNTRTNCAASGGGGGGYTPFANFTALVNTGWSWINQGSSTVNFSGGIASLSAQSTGGDNARSYVQSLPAAPWTVIMASIPTPGVIPGAATQGGGFLTGLVISDGTKLITYDFSHAQNSNVGITLEIAQFNSSTSFNSDTKNEAMQTTPPVCWLKIQDDGTNRLYFFSIDPVNVGWTQITSEGNTTFLTPTKAGFVVNVYNSASGGANFLGDAVMSWQITTP